MAAATSGNYSQRAGKHCDDIEHAALLVVALHEAWCVFIRQVFYDSAFGKARTASGAVLRRIVSCRSSDDLLRIFTAKNLKQRWNQSSEVISLARQVGLENALTIGGALGDSRAASLADLRKVRNALVHPNERTLKEFREVLRRDSLSALTTPIEYVFMRRGAARTFEIWLSNLELVAEALVR